MTFVALVFAALAAALHVFIWTMESLTWRRPATWRRFAVASQADADTTAPMAFNQGFYNLFLAVITVVGIVLVAADRHGGWALLFAGTGSMLAAALVLVSTGRKYLRAASTQGLFPALALVFGVVACVS